MLHKPMSRNCSAVLKGITLRTEQFDSEKIFGNVLFIPYRLMSKRPNAVCVCVTDTKNFTRLMRM